MAESIATCIAVLERRVDDKNCSIKKNSVSEQQCTEEQQTEERQTVEWHSECKRKKTVRTAGDREMAAKLGTVDRREARR